MLPTRIADEIAKRSFAAAASAGLVSAHYPAPGGLPTLPTLVILWDGFDVAEMNEQFLMLRYRGLLFTSLSPIESQITSIDPLVLPIIDAFSALGDDTSNYRLKTADGQGVEYCRVERGEMGVPIPYEGNTHYGGRLFWGVKVRRQPGDT